MTASTQVVLVRYGCTPRAYSRYANGFNCCFAVGLVVVVIGGGRYFVIVFCSIEPFVALD